MTTFDPSERDELVSAFIDGEATDEEVALVESTPELMERVALLRSISEMVAAPVEPTIDRREAHIAAGVECHAKTTRAEPHEELSFDL